MSAPPAPSFHHLARMTDHRGTFEHARYDLPRPEHGYCTDDMARVLLVTTREPDPTPEVRRLTEVSLRFLVAARDLQGCYRNRLDVAGRWRDGPTVEDCWGRSLWGLGSAVVHSDDEEVRRTARGEFERAARQRSADLRATAFAALGAVEVLSVEPRHPQALQLLVAAADSLPAPSADPAWPWPEPRLRYANAVVPHAMIVVGATLGRSHLERQGLDLLAWLLDEETVDGHLSVTPAYGAGPGATRPAFDQQPIEVAALAEACARAAAVDEDPRWGAGLRAAVDWFLGDNDGCHLMFDPETGAAFDGLMVDGVNRNQGTESTLALASTLQLGRSVLAVAR